MTPVTVCFTLDAAELARVQAKFSKIRPRLSIGLAVTLAFIFVLQGVLGISRHHDALAIFGYVQILFGVAYVPLTWFPQSAALLLAMPSQEIELLIDDAGLTLQEPSKHFPWKRITAIRDVGEAFVATRTYGRGILILKRALPDGGSALWAALDAKLTASRYLVRGTDSRLTINNTAARR